MFITKLRLVNFKSYKKVEFNFKKNSLVLIKGENGAGKSTIIDSLRFVFFSKKSKGIKYDSLVRDGKNKDCSVTVWLEDGDDYYYIKRYRKHHTMGNEVHVYKNSNLLEYDKSDDANSEIERIIGMDYETFQNSVIFGQGTGRLFCLSKGSERKKVLETIFHLEEWDIYKKRADNKFNDYKAKETLFFGKKIELEERLENLREMKKNQKTDMSNTLDAEYTKKKYEFDKVVNIMATISKEIEDFDKKKDYNKFDINRCELEDKIDKSNKRIIFLEKNIKELFAEVSKMESIVNNPDKHLDGKTSCPTCMRPIDSDTMRFIVNHYSVKITEKKFVLKCNEDGKKLELLNYERLRKGLRAINDNIDELKEERQELESKFSSLKISKKHYSEDLAEIKGKLEEIRIGKCSDLRAVLEAIRDTKDKIEEVSISAAKYNRFKGYYEYLADTFPKIKLNIINGYIESINDRVNHYLGRIYEGRLIAEMDTITLLKNGDIRDKIDIKIISDGKKRLFEDSSGGEQRGVDLSFMFAFQDINIKSNKINMFFADEVFDWFDDVRTNNLIEILEDISRNASVYVISHNDALKDKFEDIISISKVDGRSEIVEV
jgi:DNA repair exonuclease SbcCD ATPase subunit